MNENCFIEVHKASLEEKRRPPLELLFPNPSKRQLLCKRSQNETLDFEGRLKNSKRVHATRKCDIAGSIIEGE